MNLQEKKMINLLSELKDKYHILGVKAEFESEGATLKEVVNLKKLVDGLSLDLTVKIGGCEAVRDLYELKSIGVNSIVAPMIESFYAFKKYIQACNSVFLNEERKNIKFFINIETVGGYRCLDEILNSEIANDLSGIVFGRTDMTGSLGMNKDEINSDLIFDYAKEISKKVKEYNKEFIIGGGLNLSSVPFLKKIPEGFLNKFETRKVIFDAQSILNTDKVEEGILKAFEFELLWLKNRENICGIMNYEDNLRIEMLENSIS